MMDEIIHEFLIESHESLEAMDNQLVQLERDPHAKDILESVFRAVHTIKGTAGALGFTHLEALTHAAENLLDDARRDELALHADVISVLLAAVDTTRAMLADIEEQGSDEARDVSDMVARLEKVHEQSSAPGQPVGECAPPDVDDTDIAEVASPQVADQSLRVSVDLLEQLMNLVGELVLARNQILQHVDDDEDREFLATTQRLNLITSELQGSVMRARMKPIRKIWNKFPRLVRDIAHTCKKQVRVEMEGQDTELDKTLIEAINDPLIHLVRNAVDHGIEPPHIRRAQGKPEEGCVRMSARHQDGQVHIDISDDGGGIDVDRLRENAIAKKLVTPAQADRMSDQDLFRVIFAPGFSTAKTLTNVSGRGVGMDVVRTNIERIGGSIEIKSVPGEGTSIEIEIPLTLAIIPALIVRCREQPYAIPQVNLLELVRLDAQKIADDIDTIYNAPVYRLRGRLLPLVFLHRELGLTSTSAEALAQREDGLNIVIVQVSGEPFGLVVDDIVDTEEIVVKPLAPQLSDIFAYAGATIMGDGQVALILDIPGIARAARVLASQTDLRRVLDEEREHQEEEAVETRRALLVATPDDGRLVMPLCEVSRLEKIPNEAIELVGGTPVVQYRDSILPLIFLSDVLAGRPSDPERHLDTSDTCSPLQVVVYTREQRTVGLVVNHIIDIVDTTLDLQLEGGRPGVLGSSIVDGRVTEVLDLDAIVAPHMTVARATG